MRRPVHFHRILAPMDFSEHSLKALEYALALAAEYQSALWVLHVIEPQRGLAAAGFPVNPACYREGYLGAVRERLA